MFFCNKLIKMLYIFTIFCFVFNVYGTTKLEYKPSKTANEAVKKFINAENGNFLQNNNKTPLKINKQDKNIVLKNYIVASVNGEAITIFDIASMTFAQERNMLQRIRNPKRQLEVVKKIRHRALDHLIERKLIIQDYHDKPFDIEEQYIESEIDRLAELSKIGNRIELRKKMKADNKTLEDLRKQAKNNIIFQMMVSSYFYNEMNLTPKDIYNYYKKNITKFKQPKAYKFTTLFLKNNTGDIEKKVEKISNDLKSNNRDIFYSLKQIYNPTEKSKQSLNWFNENKLRKEFVSALAKLKVNQISKPIKIKEGVFFLLVEDIRPAKTIPINEAYTKIKKILEYKLHKKIYDKKITELKAKSVIIYEF